MGKKIEVVVQKNKMSLFGRAREALAEIGIDLETIVETYGYFVKQRAEDPELKIPIYKVRIPSGAGKMFEIITGDDDFYANVPKFKGVVASFHNCNALFPEGDVMNQPPVCSSVDGYEGIELATGEVKNCSECQHNQWGSSPKGGRGKACKNMRRLFILAEGSDMPVILTLPPTSIAGWDTYKSAVLGVQRYSPQEIVTEFSLDTNTNMQGIKYSVVKFKAVGVIGNEHRMAVKALGTGEIYDKNIGSEDYNVSSTLRSMKLFD